MTGDHVLDESPGARRRFTDSYGLVLVLLVISYFCAATLGGSSWGHVTVILALAATTWLALRASDVQRLPMRIAQALIPLLCVVAIIAQFIGQQDLTDVVSGLIMVVLVLIAPLAILGHLAKHLVVTVETFLGAVCVYLLIAQLFATSFALLATISGQPFFAQTTEPSTVDYIYFSFVTIATVGYGDYTAAESVGRMLAVTEAVIGQLYLITVVSLVVQNLGARRKREGGTGEAPRE
jgi:hypothetical protein